MDGLSEFFPHPFRIIDMSSIDDAPKNLKQNAVRPTPSVDVSKGVSSELEGDNTSVSEQGRSSGTSQKVLGLGETKGINQRNWNNLKSQQLGKDFLMQNKACYKCGYFDHLTSNYGVWVAKGETWPRDDYSQNNMKFPSTHKSMTPRAVLLKFGSKPIVLNKLKMNVAQPKMKSFVKSAHSNGKGPLKENQQLKIKLGFQKFPLVEQKFLLLAQKFPLPSQQLLLIWETRERLLRPQLVGVGNLSKIKGNIDDKGYWDSGCFRHMTGNISYLSDYEPYNGGYVSFGYGGGKITGKGTIKTGKLEFENVYFVKELKYNLFSVSQICDNKHSVLFTDSECLVLGKDFKLADDSHVLLRIPRHQNMYSIDLKNVVPHKNLTCLIAKASKDESMLWHKRLGHLNFKTMNKLVKNNLVKGLPFKSFANNHTCVACLKGKQHKASCKTKLVNSVSKPLHTLHMDLFGPTSVSSLNHKWYCLVVTGDFSRFTWTFFQNAKSETSRILRNFITEIENLKDLKVKIIRCDNGGEFRNREMDEFYSRKGIKREFNNARTPQQNGVAERRNRTLIEAARTMLADARLPVTFWAEVVNTACYVQNRVLVNKSQKKTPYELFNGRSPAIGFLRPFGCHVMILNTLDHLGKFDAKGDEGYFVGYSLNSKAFRVFNKRTKKIEENLHVDFLENQPIEKGAGPNWLFDIDSLTKTMNYVPVIVTGTSSTNISSTKEVDAQAMEENVSTLRFIALPNWFDEAHMTSSHDSSRKSDAFSKKDVSQNKQDSNADVSESSGNSNPIATSKDPTAKQEEPILTSTVETEVPTVSSFVPTDCLSIPPVSSGGPRIISKGGSSYPETPSLGNAMSFENRLEDLFGDSTASVSLNEVEADLSNMETNIQASLTLTLRINKDHPKNQIIGPIDTPVQTRHKVTNMEEQSFIATIHQKTNPDLLQFNLFSCFLSQEEPKKLVDALKDLSWVEAIQEELLQFKIQDVWVLIECPKGVRPIGTKRILKNKRDLRGIVIRNKARLVAQGVYKVVKAMYGLHQAPKAWYGTLSKYLLDNGFQRGTIDQTLFIRKEFEALMHEKFKMSAMGELTFSLGLQVLQKNDGIFLSQDKYVADILKKFGLSDVRSAKTLMNREHPWGKDGSGKDVELHLYRSMIGSLMYLTASRPDIMFAICACAKHQVTPKECHLHAVKSIFRYLKGHPKLGLWYPKESPFDLVAFSDSDYGGANQDRKICGSCKWLWTSAMDTKLVAGLWKLINVDHINTDENVADLLTKAFDVGRFQYLVFPLLGQLSTVSVFLGFGLTTADEHVMKESMEQHFLFSTVEDFLLLDEDKDYSESKM
ncbi:putative ribonuclease H-like domain-containing protein [Tanacetum coccineum]